MKCQSKCSPQCKNIITKLQTKYIWVDGKALEVCENCYGKIKRDKKSTGNKAGRPNKMMDILIETQKRVNKKNGNK